ncbi:protein-glutamine gamma-glutamyltransferase E [Engraulis encrasicolus]|uniref:protein-glutamine gamma-glutamyltransferase E n=1 Tax=Engraulis encrasicolus TaxID=184585 RepID=UPI002FD32120
MPYGTTLALAIRDVDLHVKENNKAHSTEEISTKRLIVRRGQNFQLTLHTSRQFKPDADELFFTVETGTWPSEAKGTRCVFGLGETNAKSGWTAQVQDSDNSSVTLAISSPANACVGLQTLIVKVGSQNAISKPVANLTVLFNPWCTDDSVYLQDEDERQEYVMNENGLIYRGSSDRMGPMDWDFGQFEEDMVDICLKLLDMNPKCLRDAAEDVSARCNPIYVGRVISAMINANDDRGVLVGRWSAPYSGGVAPTQWSGSVDILRQWYKKRCAPVNYGQCWVFAGVMCTVMRCLGIPCRVVTNFDSAHDTDKSLTIDSYYDENGLRAKDSRDSVWNFHVWVEAWMKRPDLSRDSTYDGWQVLDPTPQEKSTGVYCCGPCPVKAILEGHTDMKYDAPFVFAEVNADQVSWIVGEDGSERRLDTDTRTVGKNISTKAVGKNRRQDLTNNYKYSEGSERERDVFEEAVRRGDMERPILPSSLEELEELGNFPEIAMKLAEKKQAAVGEDVELTLVLHSEHQTSQELSVKVNAQAMRYTGVPDSLVWRQERDIQLQPKQDLEISIQIPYSAYGSKMLGNNSMKVSALVFSKQDLWESYLAEKNIVLEDPTLIIKAPSTCHQYMEMTVELMFHNPLDSPLRHGLLRLSGSGLVRDTMLISVPHLPADHRVRLQIPISPYRVGKHKLVANFDCSALRDIKACCDIEVLPHLVLNGNGFH